jgi:putative ABC transport system substrate-binding protein
MATRRLFLAATLAVLSARLAAQEKPPARTYRVGLLEPVSLQSNAANISELRKGLKELGYAEGQNLAIEYRSAEGRPERYPGLAAELVRSGVDVIVTSGTPASLAARNASQRISVVTANVVDPVETKLVASFAKPGGNLTGLGVVVAELEAKRIELLRALAPGRKRIAALMDMGNPALMSVWKATEAAARAQGLQAHLIDVRRPEQFAAAFDAVAAQQAEALVVRVGALAPAHRQALVDFAARHKLPAIFTSRQFVDLGGLVSYGLNLPNMYYRAAAFVDKILKGAPPAELPMERPTKFELVINRRTAHTLGVVVPPDLLLRSDQMVG